jgi:anti-sigma regulatory factor (Ser/Thr protein kinase)
MTSSILLSVTREDSCLLCTIASDITLIHPAIRLSEEFVHQHGASDTSKIFLVLRELLSNAIVHGNKNMLSRNVTCRIEHMGERLFRIAVEDEGEGFDFASLDTSFPDDPRTITKRGYILLRHLCTTLEFNEHGNRVTALVEGCDTGGQPIPCALRLATSGGRNAAANPALRKMTNNICRECG